MLTKYTQITGFLTSSANHYVAALLVALFVAGVAPRLISLSGGPQLPGSGELSSPMPVLILSLVLNGMLLWKLKITHLAKEVSEEEQREKEHDALHDPLTGAANRRSFEARLLAMTDSARPAHALLMIDLDNFKPVNDTYGHAAGDQVLCEITAGIRRLSRPKDLVSRLGGDEFAVLVTDVDETTAEDIACELLDFVTGYRLSWKGNRIQVGTSIGLVLIDKPGMNSGQILEAADVALYAAKDAGRGAVMAMPMPDTYNAGYSFSPSVARRVDPGVPEPTNSAQSHQPTDGRKQVLMGIPTVTRADIPDDRRARERRGKTGPERWIMVEPATVGNDFAPGMSGRELVADAELRSDGGADLVRWTLAMLLNAASRVSKSQLNETGFVLPLPARSLVVVPGLSKELAQSLALSAHPIRHLTLVLLNASKVHDDPALETFVERMHTSGVKVAFQIRNTSMESLAPLKHAPFDQIHMAREIHRSIRPGTAGHTSIKALQMMAENASVALVASEVDNTASLQHLAQLGITQISGPAIGSVERLDKALKRAHP